MAIQTVKKGEFDFTPNKIMPFLGFDRVGYVCVFHENCNYDYHDMDQQKDVLKIGGAAFALFPWQKHQNTAMVGFNYNPDTDVMQLYDYWHKDGVTDKAIGRAPIAYVKRKEKFVWWIRADKATKQVSINIRTKNGTVSKLRQFNKLNTWLCWPVGGYAGGDVRAVQEMSFSEEKVNEWGVDGPVIDLPGK